MIELEKNMSKNIKLVIFIFTIAIFLQSCKNPVLDFEWYLFEADGTYSSENDSSYLKLNAWVEINQSSVNTNPASPVDSTHFMYASVVNWNFRVYSGEQLVFQITKYNIESLFGDILLNVAENQSDYLWVAIESETPLSGDIFNGMNPDSVEFEMTMSDGEGGGYSILTSVPFIFNRN